MLSFYKIDYYLQYGLCILLFLSIPVLFLYGFMAGLFILGCWQLLSAALTTPCFLKSGQSKIIFTYWKWTGLILALLLLYIPLSILFDTDDLQVIGVIAVIGSIPVAFYYLLIYKRLIDHLSIKKEIAGIIKSNH
ncbi:MAG TPA: hypothetical protein VF487_20520 [Chitinophagaceae bacterium]